MFKNVEMEFSEVEEGYIYSCSVKLLKHFYDFIAFLLYYYYNAFIFEKTVINISAYIMHRHKNFVILKEELPLIHVPFKSFIIYQMQTVFG